MKIRGTALHIAEKYTGLARDALSFGDTVIAENYLQHAEHYQRTIMAAQTQQVSSAQADTNGAGNQRQQQPASDENNSAVADAEVDSDGAAADEKVSAKSTKSNAAEIEANQGEEASPSNGSAGAVDEEPSEGDASPDTATSA